MTRRSAAPPSAARQKWVDDADMVSIFTTILGWVSWVLSCAIQGYMVYTTMQTRNYILKEPSGTATVTPMTVATATPVATATATAVAVAAAN